MFNVFRFTQGSLSNHISFLLKFSCCSQRFSCCSHRLRSDLKFLLTNNLLAVKGFIILIPDLICSSIMEFDLTNVTYNQSDFVDDPMNLQNNVHIIVFAIASIISSICDLLIIISIFQHSVMRTKRNLLILNWAFADFFFQLQEPNKYFILHLMFGTDFYTSFGCVLYEHEATFLCLVCLFVLILNVNFFYKRLTIFSLKIVAAVLWLLTFSTVIAMTTLCMTLRYFPIHILVLLLVILIILTSYIVKLVMYSIRRINRKEKDTKLRYILSTGFALCFFPATILFTLHAGIHSAVLIFLTLIGNLNPMLNIFLLYYYDKNFKLSFLNIIRCKPAGYLGSTLSYDNGSDTNLNVSPNVVESVNVQD